MEWEQPRYFEYIPHYDPIYEIACNSIYQCKYSKVTWTCLHAIALWWKQLSANVRNLCKQMFKTIGP